MVAQANKTSKNTTNEIEKMTKCTITYHFRTTELLRNFLRRRLNAFPTPRLFNIQHVITARSENPGYAHTLEYSKYSRRSVSSTYQRFPFQRYFVPDSELIVSPSTQLRGSEVLEIKSDYRLDSLRDDHRCITPPPAIAHFRSWLRVYGTVCHLASSRRRH